MSEVKQGVTNEQIEQFLQGSDPQKYIVAVEAEFNTPTVTLVISEPNQEKRLEQHKYQPFLWFKQDVVDKLYGGKRMKIMEACQKHEVKINK